MKQTKKKQGLPRLLEIAGQKKGLLLLAGLLSAGSAVCMLVPYWAVYEVLKELLTHGGNPAASDGAVMIRWGWIAFGGLAGGLVLLYAALMSSHVAAFRILYGLRVRLSEHIGRLPLGFLSRRDPGDLSSMLITDFMMAVGRGTFAACLRAVPRGRLPCVRPTDFRPDQLCRIPLFLHCRRTHPFADGRAGNERGTAIPGGRRHPV